MAPTSHLKKDKTESPGQPRGFQRPGHGDWSSPTVASSGHAQPSCGGGGTAGFLAAPASVSFQGPQALSSASPRPGAFLCPVPTLCLEGRGSGPQRATGPRQLATEPPADSKRTAESPRPGPRLSGLSLPRPRSRSRSQR